MKKIFLFFFLLGVAIIANAQKKETTFGIQFRPILPVEFGSVKNVTNQEGPLKATYTSNFGRTMGVVVRKGFTDQFSLEVGLGFVRRNYTVTLEQIEDNYKEEVNFGFIGYELPIQALYYVQMSKNIYLNASSGLSIDMYPSHVEAFADDLRHMSLRYAWVRPALLANVGAEYRSKVSGYFYLGLSYHRSIWPIIVNNTVYAPYAKVSTKLINSLNGHYFTLDFRYFFNDKKNKKADPKSGSGRF